MGNEIWYSDYRTGFDPAGEVVYDHTPRALPGTIWACNAVTLQVITGLVKPLHRTRRKL